MARDFNAATPDKIVYATPYVPTAIPQTISMWIHPDTVSTFARLWFVTAAGGATGAVMLMLRGDKGAGIVSFLVVTTGGIYGYMARESASGAVATSGYQHVLATWDGVSSYESTPYNGAHIYVNGTEVSYSLELTDDGQAVAATGDWALGVQPITNAQGFDGRMAGLGWWNRVLASDERVALAKRYSPLWFRRGLKWGPDLDGHYGCNDWISGKTATITGTAKADHPGLIYPSSY